MTTPWLDEPVDTICIMPRSYSSIRANLTPSGNFNPLSADADNAPSGEDHKPWQNLPASLDNHTAGFIVAAVDGFFRKGDLGGANGHFNK